MVMASSESPCTSTSSVELDVSGHIMAKMTVKMASFTCSSFVDVLVTSYQNIPICQVSAIICKQFISKQNMLIPILILIAGLILLIVGADQLVKGASSVARRFGLSSMLIGLTIVAFGSSAPELIVNIFAASKGSYGVAFGNILGSNIANILLILGIAALIRPLKVSRSIVAREVPFMILGMVVLLGFVSDKFLGSGGQDMLSRGEGIALIGFFGIFLYFTFATAFKHREEQKKVKKKVEHEDGIVSYTMWRSSLMVLAGLAGLVIGGQLIVDSAITIAQGFGVSDALIALTIVAIGTSLPELAASGMAAYRGDTDMAVGNVIGSNIFNIFWILGLSSTIRPLLIDSGAISDVLIVLAASVLLLPFIFRGKKSGKSGYLGKFEGISFLLIYFAYIAFAIWRG